MDLLSRSSADSPRSQPLSSRTMMRYVTKNRDIQLSLRITQSHDDYDVHVQNLQNAIPDSGPACHAIPIKKHQRL